MELKSKCSSKKHGNIEANVYCKDCNIFLCNKCQNFHSDLFQNHKICEINNSNFEKEIFTGFCGEQNHFEKLEFYCKTHNKLCCSSCIIKIQKKGKGRHSNCEICVIEEIRDKKKENLNNNLSYLKNLSKTYEQSIIGLKQVFDEIQKDKDNLKIEIQNLFTKIRNKLNEKEEQLFSEIDKQYDNYIFNENVFKKSEKIPIKIKMSIEKGEETLKSNWSDDNILSKLINNCIIIENNLNDINNINFNIKKIKSNNIKLKLNLQKKDIDNFIDSINNFGKIVKYYREKIVDIKKFYENNFNENINFSLLRKNSYDDLIQLEKKNNIKCRNLTPKNDSFKKKVNKKNVHAKMNFKSGFNNNNLNNDFKINKNSNFEYKNNFYDYANNNRNNNINNSSNFIRKKTCNNNNYNNNFNIYNSNSKNTNKKYQNKQYKFQ